MELERSARPVSGDVTRRDAISRLIGRHDSVTSLRPEQVLVEVNALIERRPVTSVLQTARFRQSIENSLRRAIHSVCCHGDELSPWQPQQLPAASDDGEWPCTAAELSSVRRQQCHSL